MKLNIRQKKALVAEENKVLCLASAGSGKALPNSTVIPTTEGKKRVGDIKIGDYLFDRYGNPTKVLGIYPQGKKEVYEITFGDKRKAKCSKDHIWYVNKRTWKNKNDFREMTVDEILKDKWEIIDKRGHKSHQFSIPCSKAVSYSEKKYDIHPYVIGAFLGDGCCREHQLILSSEDDVIPNHIAQLLGDNVTIKKLSKNNFNWTFKQNGENLHSNILPKELINYSYDKCIPEEYKYGSIEQRLQLVRGLMDTDGSISKIKGREGLFTAPVSFSSTSYQLILDLQEVLGSLGYISTILTDTRVEKYTKEEAYKLSINISNLEKEKLFWLPRKKEIALSIKEEKQHRNYDKTTISNIESLGYEEEMTCFYVDNEEHLFLMNDFIVTHNTRLITERVNYLINEKNIKPKDIVSITFTNQAAQEMRDRLGNIAEEVFIGTIHSYANKICSLNHIDNTEYILRQKFDKIIEKALTLPSTKYQNIKYLFIDECQDISSLEYNFLMKIPTENIFFCGDSRQAIYSFRGCSDEYLHNMYLDDSYKKYYLVENYRNPPNIVTFAENFLNNSEQLSPHTIPIKTKNGLIEECGFIDALEELEWSGDWGNWAILTRTNNEIEAAQQALDKRDIPNVTFKKGDLDNFELKALMATNRVKILTIHSAKGEQFKNVIVVGARVYSEEERRIAYVAATRAEQSLYWCPTIAKRSFGKSMPPSAKAGNLFDKSDRKVIKF
jgi:hypothetical protein